MRTKGAKNIGLRKAKARAWNQFSLYIRRRDGFKCVTCGRTYPENQRGGIQGGHFVAGRHNSILFDERNCHAQCYGCNVMKRGAPTQYWLFMEQKYGRAVIDELIFLDSQTKQMKEADFQEIYEKYKKLNT